MAPPRPRAVVEPETAELVMAQARCSRARATHALGLHNDDMLGAILHLSSENPLPGAATSSGLTLFLSERDTSRLCCASLTHGSRISGYALRPVLPGGGDRAVLHGRLFFLSVPDVVQLAAVSRASHVLAGDDRMRSSRLAWDSLLRSSRS